MNVIAAYVITKEKLSREVAEKTAELYMSGMKYEKALKRAKDVYNKEKINFMQAYELKLGEGNSSSL